MTEQLRGAVLGGHFPPGTALNQRDIADQLRVSRMPVREAFRALEIEGLIRTLPRRKAVVVSLQPEDIVDIFDILATLERRAAERAATSMDRDALPRLRALNDAFRACSDDASDLAARDLDLHLAIYQPPTSRLRLLIQAHRNAIGPYARAGDAFIKRWDLAEAEHDRILDALEARDPVAAAREAAAHVRAEGEALVEHLRAARLLA